MVGAKSGKNPGVPVGAGADRASFHGRAVVETSRFAPDAVGARVYKSQPPWTPSSPTLLDTGGGRSGQPWVLARRHRHQTLATMRRPNMPDGRTTSTPTMITSATESFTSAPTR